MLKLSLPFLATSESQLEALPKNLCGATEAVIFNREDLEEDNWKAVWKNIDKAIKTFGPKNTVFHFPVNNSDYVSDNFVRSKLQEAYNRVTDLNMAGMVVHSNRIRIISEWNDINLDSDRMYVTDVLQNVLANSNSEDRPWIGLENMPVMDNHGVEIDPLFCYPDDFNILNNTDINITWDICHYTNTLANTEQVLNQTQNKKYYPNLKKAELKDFCRLSNKVMHWHFSAFKGIANPDTDDICIEGCMPEQSTLGEEIYAKSLHHIKSSLKSGQIITLEIQEQDYLNRVNGPQTIQWINNILLNTEEK